jgi:hypothetical protein
LWFPGAGVPLREADVRNDDAEAARNSQMEYRETAGRDAYSHDAWMWMARFEL